MLGDPTEMSVQEASRILARTPKSAKVKGRPKTHERQKPPASQRHPVSWFERPAISAGINLSAIGSYSQS
jgi:hypothetical protein